MAFRYKVWYNKNNKRYMSDCSHSANIATAVARKRLTEGATDVTIEVTMEDSQNDGDDPSWPPIEIE